MREYFKYKTKIKHFFK